MTRRKREPLEAISNKVGRLDCLLFGASKILLTKVEERLGLNGIWEGLKPIVEKEIRRGVSAGSVIPEEYHGLMSVIGKRFKV